MMMLWLGSVLWTNKVDVKECPGWATRTHGPFGPPRGVMIHHTAGSLHGDAPSLDEAVKGRNLDDPEGAGYLLGPLYNCLVSRAGIWYLVAAGRAYHAGDGVWGDIVDTGNVFFIGVALENAGTEEDVYPAVQLDSAVNGVRALLKKTGAAPAMCIGHREYAPHRKIDPIFDMDAFRARLKTP